jgi:hypothetical protein
MRWGRGRNGTPPAAEQKPSKWGGVLGEVRDMMGRVAAERLAAQEREELKAKQRACAHREWTLSPDSRGRVLAACTTCDMVKVEISTRSWSRAAAAAKTLHAQESHAPESARCLTGARGFQVAGLTRTVEKQVEVFPCVVCTERFESFEALKTHRCRPAIEGRRPPSGRRALEVE